MRIAAVPDSVVEGAALALKRVPIPFLDTHPSLVLARAVMVATKLGLFEALERGTASAEEVAQRCGTHAGATEALLAALAGAGYLAADGEGYRLAPLARKWLLKSSPQSLRDSILFRFLEWDWISGLEDFIRSGRPIDFHAEMSGEQWRLYQRAMYALARLAAPELTRRAPVPKGARRLLDLGGSHGHFSVALCRRHPWLEATVLDLPEAVEHAAPLLAAEGMGERVQHRVDDVRSADLGRETWDIVLVSQLVHHFDAPTNRRLMQRIAAALRPGGVVVVYEIGRQPPGRGGQLTGLGGLYFALTSRSGAWSFAEIAQWQRDAELTPRRPIRFRTLPGTGLQSADKPH